MNFIDIILKKRDGNKLTQEEINFFIDGVTHDTLPDYQISAFLMATLFSSMDAQETAWLTTAMVHSGKSFDLSAVKGFKVDKHSTGGVADTTTLILAPLVASCGVPVVKMSGRGLGFSGGTLDKLESIPHFRVDVSEKEAISFAQKSNLVIMSQTTELTPADQKLYALRDVTGTVDSIPLIAASVMSKKIAAGADGIVLDVKCGSGAFMKDLSTAQALGNLMVSMGKHVGKKITAIISSMDQPLGQYIGNRLEVLEAISILKGETKGDLLTVSLELGANMLLLANRVATLEEGKALLLQQIENGQGLEKFKELLAQQGGNTEILQTPSLLTLSPICTKVIAQTDGYLTKIRTAELGRAAQKTGAGRTFKGEELDYGAGIILKYRLGDAIKKGDVLAEIYSKEESRNQQAKEIIENALVLSKTPEEIPPLILARIE